MKWSVVYALVAVFNATAFYATEKYQLGLIALFALLIMELTIVSERRK